MTNSEPDSKRIIAIVTIGVVLLVTISLVHVALTTQMWREFAESMLDVYITAAVVFLFTTDQV